MTTRPQKKRPAKRRNILDLVKEAMANGLLIPSEHAQQRMRERDIDFSDIEEAVVNGFWEKSKDQYKEEYECWNYAIRGENNRGDKDIRIIVEYEDLEAVIITAIDKKRRK